MKLRQINKKAQIGQIPQFFQIMMLVVVFAGVTFIVVEQFMGVSYKETTVAVANESNTVTDAE